MMQGCLAQYFYSMNVRIQWSHGIRKSQLVLSNSLRKSFPVIYGLPIMRWPMCLVLKIAFGIFIEFLQMDQKLRCYHTWSTLSKTAQSTIEPSGSEHGIKLLTDLAHLCPSSLANDVILRDSYNQTINQICLQQWSKWKKIYWFGVISLSFQRRFLGNLGHVPAWKF